MTTTVGPRTRRHPHRSPTDQRVDRLNRVSSARPIEPDSHLPWGTLGAGQVIADELLTIDGLEIDGQPVTLTDEQRALSPRGSRGDADDGRALRGGPDVRLRAWQIAESSDLSNPRVTYLLHEIGEEARHSRVCRAADRRAGSHREEPVRHAGRELHPLQADPFTRQDRGAPAGDGVGRRGDPRSPPEARCRTPAD